MLPKGPLLLIVLFLLVLSCQKDAKEPPAAPAPSCATICAHVVQLSKTAPKLLDFRDQSPKWQAAVLEHCIKSCTADAWSDEGRSCVLKATKLSDMDACPGIKKAK